MLEAFGQCEVLTEDGESVKLPPIIRMNWTLLPPGTIPWERVIDTVRSSHGNKFPRNMAAIEERLSILNKFKPTKIAIGNQGFAGYAVFCFEEQDVYVMECQRPDNATYVMGNNWQSISQLTKAEVLNGDFHRQRIIHGPNWQTDVGKLLAYK
jgi:hypothetical protein